ncbi:A/G-specific adenine glycosylase [Aeromicrobium sp. IC_218]|uniref:A/G-specific adenine glycosylase n=1 Tax=Aeromicrobium sp. IC_218 TaxID=2545468 RepID=UPI00103AAC0D|nr:A/G-specific adenine glycosylase [Aeromicrobium sp. IC_218]TCJ00785.1 A/G-specific adenine glycosylase [Aeromicrobium sp. IC_218]
MTAAAFPASLVTELHERLADWFAHAARDLPWRRDDATAWHVMISELMLQQTPVVRVLPVYEQWVRRWPEPADLAAEPAGEAVRAWGRLGYPRRALRLHAAAQAIVERHDGVVPRDLDALLALPGVGAYTAAAVASFAYGGRHAVLDTNVRRVLTRVVGGEQYPPASVTAAERRRAEQLLPQDGAPVWAASTMELGAIVCTAASPTCAACPVADLCRWRASGYPEHDGPARRTQTWEGTDRQCRGRLLAVLRDAPGPVDKARLDEVWPDDAQRERALDGLVADGLVEPVTDTLFALPR